MENQLSEKISDIDHLIYKGKDDEALKEIKKLEKKKIDKETKLSLLLLKSKLMYRLDKYEKALTFADTAVKSSKILDLPLQELEALIQKTAALLSLNRYEEVFKIIKKGEKKLDSISNHSKEKRSKEGDLLYLLGEYYRHKDEYDKALDYHMQGLKIRQKIGNKQNMAYSMIGIGRALWRKGELEQALDYSEKSFRIHEKIGNKLDIANSLVHIGLIHSGKGESDTALEYNKQCIKIYEGIGHKKSVAGVLGFSAMIHSKRGELDTALEYNKQCKKIYEELENRKDVAYVLHNSAGIHLYRGELDKALDYYKQSHKIFKELGHKYTIAHSLLARGNVFLQKGKFDLATSNYEQSLEILEEIGNEREISNLFSLLISVAIDKKEFGEANKLLKQLQQIYEKDKNKYISLNYRLSLALVLKTSKRAKNIAQAEELLKEIVDEEILVHQMTVKASLLLCDLLIEELQLSGEEELIEEIHQLLDKLFVLAVKEKNHALHAEVYWLQARLALLKFDTQEARRKLTQAQLIADEKGLHRLARKISAEYDSLLRQLDKWEELEQKDISLIERLQETGINELTDNIRKQREIELPQSDDEEPVQLLLIAEKSGLSVFSKSFKSLIEVEEQLLGGLLTAMRGFGEEIFSQPLERVKIGEFILILHASSPFLICYVFKGQSYSAMKKVLSFCNLLKEDIRMHEIITHSINSGIGLDIFAHDTLGNIVEQIFIN